MKRATWSVGWYSKVVLTIIAISLVGSLVRQLPGKVEAKPERENKAREVFFLELHPAGREHALLHTVNGETYTRLKDTRGDIQVNAVLGSLYSGEKYRPGKFKVKFVTNDFIILESE